MNLFAETAEMRARRTAAEGEAPTSLWRTDAPEKTPQHQQRQPNQVSAAVRETLREMSHEVVRPDGSYSLEQESYQAEIAFDKRRTRRRKLLAAVRTLAAIVLVPVVLAAIFLVSYTLTCILSGASPEEVVELLGDLLRNVIELFQSIV